MKLPRLAVPSTQDTSDNSFWPGFASRRVRKSAVVNTPRRNISSMQGNQLRPVCEEGYGLLEEECPEPIFSSECPSEKLFDAGKIGKKWRKTLRRRKPVCELGRRNPRFRRIHAYIFGELKCEKHAPFNLGLTATRSRSWN
jgi:hypothetical protein